LAAMPRGDSAVPPGGWEELQVGARFRLGARRSARREVGRPYNLPRVYWPLIGGFIAFLIVLLLLGWILDRSEQRDPGRQQH
jgi:hypothetical protein